MNPLVDPSARLVIGHRGCAGLAPENTLEGLQRARALGVDAVEFDVRLTADGVAVLMHDATLDRTTNARGPVARTSFARIREADAGARFTSDRGKSFPFRERSCRVPTLEEALAILGDTPVLVELKVPEAMPETLRVLRRHGAAGRALVDSMHEMALIGVPAAGIARGASAAGVRKLFIDTWLGRRIDALPFDALCVPPRYGALPLPLARFARTARRLARAMHAWTINDVAYATRLWGWGVNGIITDRPDLMRAALPRS